MTDVVIIGGGIAGLAAAWFLSSDDDALAVTVIEKDATFGGKIRTNEFEGRPFEEGPDAFLARVPAARDLCAEVGLADELISPATGKAYIWTGGALHDIPEDTVLGVPSRLKPILRAGMLSPAGKARAAIEPLLPRRSPAGDIAVGRFVASRFGRQVQERLVDPLIGGINAGNTEAMSLDVCAAQLAAAAHGRGSVMRGIRRQLRSAPPPTATDRRAPVFHAVRGGLSQLVGAITRGLQARGCELRSGTTATSLERAGAGWRVATSTGEEIAARAVIVAVPAFAATALLSNVSPRAARMLGGIEYASVALVTVAYPKGTVDPPEGSGFLVPRRDGRLMTACSVVTAKWPELDTAGDVVFRLSAGRFGDDGALALDDTTLAGRLTEELSHAFPVSGSPTAVRVSRWPRAFPQFAAGHLDVMAAVEGELERDAQGVALCGAAYRGVGIPACINTARAAAERVRAAAGLVG